MGSLGIFHDISQTQITSRQGIISIKTAADPVRNEHRIAPVEAALCSIKDSFPYCTLQLPMTANRTEAGVFTSVDLMETCLVPVEKCQRDLGGYLRNADEVHYPICSSLTM